MGQTDIGKLAVIVDATDPAPDARDLLRLLVGCLAGEPPTGNRPAPPGSPQVILDVQLDGARYTLTRFYPTRSERSVSLSPREREIARLVAKGLPNKSIAAVLDISPWTVATHLRRIFGKLGVNSRAEMVAKVLRAGLLGRGVTRCLDEPRRGVTLDAVGPLRLANQRECAARHGHGGGEVGVLVARAKQRLGFAQRAAGERRRRGRRGHLPRGEPGDRDVRGTERGGLMERDDGHAASGPARPGHGDALLEEQMGMRRRGDLGTAEGGHLGAQGLQPQERLLQLRPEHLDGAASPLVCVVGEANTEGVEGVRLGQHAFGAGGLHRQDVRSGEAQGRGVIQFEEVGDEVVSQVRRIGRSIKGKGGALQQGADEGVAHSGASPCHHG